MANVPTLGYVEHAFRDDANRVWVATGRGTAFNTAVFGEPGKLLSQDTPKGWYFFDESAQGHDVAMWQAMQSGDLPQLAAGLVWGVNGVISAEDAMAAVSGDHMAISTMTGSAFTYEEFRNSIFANAGLYLPEPEI